MGRRAAARYLSPAVWPAAARPDGSVAPPVREGAEGACLAGPAPFRADAVVIAPAEPAAVLAGPTGQQRLDHIVVNVEAITAEVRALIAANRSNVDATMANARELYRELKPFFNVVYADAGDSRNTAAAATSRSSTGVTSCSHTTTATRR